MNRRTESENEQRQIEEALYDPYSNPYTEEELKKDLKEQLEQFDQFLSRRRVRYPLTPTLSDYISCLATDMLNDEKERYIRIHIWWAGNDTRRETDEVSPLSSGETENLRMLIPFLDEASDNDRLMKAEAYRELGDFTVAEKLLTHSFTDNFSWAVATIRKLTEKQIKTVKEIVVE